jgi:hypothetical protein
VGFTTPKTWSFGEVLTSTDMNIYVRDNTADLDGRIPVGIGSNVVQNAVTSDISVSVNNNAISPVVTAMNTTITPTSATSKILVIVSLFIDVDASGDGIGAVLTRNGSDIFRGAAIGSRMRITMGGGSAENRSGNNIAFTALDLPNTTSPVTYSVRVNHTGSVSRTVFLNRSRTDDGRSNSGVSAITLIEVAG